MADTKLSAFAVLAVPAGVDLFPVIDDPEGTPVNRVISLDGLFGAIPSNTAISGLLSAANTTINGVMTLTGDTLNIATTKTPASASDTGTTGDIVWDADFIYVCVATDTWKRVAIATW